MVVVRGGLFVITSVYSTHAAYIIDSLCSYYYHPFVIMSNYSYYFLSLLLKILTSLLQELVTLVILTAELVSPLLSTVTSNVYPSTQN
jgi:hypothetical protein